jgi:hypothetical protein
MTRITRSADCGNSPKNLAFENLAVALEAGTWGTDGPAGDIAWNRADGSRVTGSDAIAAASAGSPDEIRIDHVVSHGRIGAVSGVTDGEAFAHIFEYTSAGMKQLARIDSFRKTETQNG